MTIEHKEETVSLKTLLTLEVLFAISMYIMKFMEII